MEEEKNKNAPLVARRCEKTIAFWTVDFPLPVDELNAARQHGKGYSFSKDVTFWSGATGFILHGAISACTVQRCGTFCVTLKEWWHQHGCTISCTSANESYTVQLSDDIEEDFGETITMEHDFDVTNVLSLFCRVTRHVRPTSICNELWESIRHGKEGDIVFKLHDTEFRVPSSVVLPICPALKVLFNQKSTTDFPNVFEFGHIPVAIFEIWLYVLFHSSMPKDCSTLSDETISQLLSLAEQLNISGQDDGNAFIPQHDAIVDAISAAVLQRLKNVDATKIVEHGIDTQLLGFHNRPGFTKLKRKFTTAFGAFTAAFK